MLWFGYAIAASFSVVVATILSKKTLLKEHAMQFTVVLALATAGISLFLFPFFDFDFSLNTFFLIILSAFIVSFAFICAAKALRHMEISMTEPFYNLGSVFIVVLAVLFLGEKLTFNQIIGVSLLILGTYILDLGDGDFFRPFKDLAHSKYIHYVLGSTFCFSLTYLLDKEILLSVNPFTLYFIKSFIASLILIIFFFFLHKGKKDLKKGFHVGGLALFLIAVFSVAEVVLTYKAMTLAPVSLVIPVYRTWVLFTVILGGRMFHDHNLRYRIFAALIMIIGVCLLI